MTLLRRAGRGLPAGSGAAILLALAALIANVGTASAAQLRPLGGVGPFHQCPPVGSDTGCAQLLVVNADGTTTAFVDSIQAPYDGSDDALIGVQNNSGHPLSELNLASPTGSDIFGFDGDGICYPSSWPAATTQNTPPGCPNPIQGVGFGLTGYEGPGNYFSNVSPNQQTGTVNFNPALRFGRSAYFGLEGALTSGQLRASPAGPIPGPVTVSGRTVQFDLTCVGAFRCAGKVRVMVKQHGKSISANLVQGKGHVVIVGSASVSIAGGETISVAVNPNSTGTRLLNRRRHGFETTIRAVIGNASYTVGVVKLP